MFPREELKAIEIQKSYRRQLSAHHRTACVAAAAEVGRPIAWIDSARARWSRVSPLVKIAGLAAGVFARKSLLPRPGSLRKWLRIGTTVLGVVRGLRAFTQR